MDEDDLIDVVYTDDDDYTDDEVEEAELPGANVYVCGMADRPAWMRGIRCRREMHCRGEADIISMHPIERSIHVYLWTQRGVVGRCYDASTLSKWLTRNTTLPISRAELSPEQILYIWRQCKPKIYRRIKALQIMHVEMAAVEKDLNRERMYLDWIERAERADDARALTPEERQMNRDLALTVLELEREYEGRYNELIAAEQRLLDE